MLDTVVRYAITSRLLVLLGLAGLLVAAALILPRLNVDAFPDARAARGGPFTRCIGQRRRDD